MKILLTIDDISITGGAIRVCVNLANALSRLGHQVQVLSFYRTYDTFPYELDSEVVLHFWSMRSESSFTAQKSKNAILKLYDKNLAKFVLNYRLKRSFNDFDAVIVNESKFVPFFKSKRTTYIKVIHEHFQKFRQRDKNFDVLVVLTAMQVDIWRSYHPNVVVIPNFLSTLPSAQADHTRKVVLSVGRMDRADVKGFDRLIDIWALVRGQSIESLQDWKLVIVGDGERKPEIEAKIKAMGLEDSIILKPFTKAIYAEYLEASIYAMCSKSEGFPLVLLEAGSHALPCVAFDVATGPSDIIQHGHSGYLVQDNDLQGFADRLLELMGSVGKRQKMGQGGGHTICEKYTQEAIMPLWDEVLYHPNTKPPAPAKKGGATPRFSDRFSESIKFYIIIPIYNVQDYLAQCLDSILVQSYINFEAILVNDGSTDKSAEIASQYAQRDSRFTLINQDNQGLSNARNTALRVIKDKLSAESHIAPPPLESHFKSYIVFVDSDDYVDSEMLAYLYGHIGDGEVESLINNSLYHIRGGALSLKQDVFIPSDSRLFDGIYTCEEVLGDSIHIHLATIAMVAYRSDFLFATQCWFEPGIYYEDVLFMNTAFLQSKKIKFINQPLYCYRSDREGSIMNAKSMQNLLHGARSYFHLAQNLDSLANQSSHRVVEAYLRYWGAFYAKQSLRCIQPFGYVEELGFSRADLYPFLPYLPFKYRLCLHFPKIYGFPKQCCLAFARWWKNKIGTLLA